MQDETFRALVVSESSDGGYTRSIENRYTSQLPQGGVLVRVRYSSLNYKDALSASGNRGVTQHYPHTPGIDAAGTVAASSSPAFTVGQSVIVTGYDLGMNTPGGYGQFIRVPAGWVVRLPQSLSLRESMAYGTAGFTAAMSVMRIMDHGVPPDQGSVLVTGATGGVGSLAVSFLARSGYRVVAASGRPALEPYLREIGASEVIARDEVNDDSGRPLLKGRWAAVVDTVGGNILATVLKSTLYRAPVTTCGNVASGNFKTTVYPFILRGVSLLGIDSAACPMGPRLAIWEKLSGDWKLDHLELIAREIALEDLDENIERMLRGRQKGRVLVNLGQ